MPGLEDDFVGRMSQRMFNAGLWKYNIIEEENQLHGVEYILCGK